MMKTTRAIFLISITIILMTTGCYSDGQSDNQKPVEVNAQQKELHQYDYEDTKEKIASIYYPGLYSRVQLARIFVDSNAAFVAYISSCKQFPEKLSDFFDPEKINRKQTSCEPISMNPVKPYDKNKEYPPKWIDPWGRPYQIRYNRERRILQVRSQGRYLGTELDDIVGETTWGMAGSLFNDEIKRCDSLPKNDMSCIFNRGWH